MRKQSKPDGIKAAINLQRFRDNILTRLKSGVSPLRENVFSCSIHPPEVSGGVLEPSNKKYCLVIFLKDIKKVKPFEIDKSGFGTMTAWLIVDDISRIKKPRNPSGKKA